MNLSREQQLLKLAANGNNTKVEHLLKGLSNKLKRWLSRDRLDDITEDIDEGSGNGKQRKASLPIVMHKQLSPHVEVNCTDEHGSTPLIIASLNGHRDIAYTLITYSADIHARDMQGHTALHMGSWQNRSEIVELLLLNGAWPGATNKEGNTPLHYAAQHCPAGKTLTIVKLLQHEANALITNNKGESPLDLAIRFNRKEAVALLVDADEDALKQAKFLVDASIAGRKEIVEILLEAGMDPNCFDSDTGLMPLHEAVRYFRKDAATLLLKFGAQPGIRNGKNESVIDIVNSHPERRRDDFMKLFKDYHGFKPKVARAELVRKKSVEELDISETSFAHPLLKGRRCWLRDTTDYCSAATKKHPASAVLDSDPTTYWMIPAPGSYNWIAFDFGSEFTLTGVRLQGWGNKTMIYSFMVETASALDGPWTQVGKYQADLLGPEEMDNPPEGQDFKGFYAKSRFWRITVADNYGARSTIVNSIEFYGVEEGIVDWFREMELGRYIKKIVESGYNQFSEIAIMSEDQMKPIVSSAIHRQTILKKAQSLKGKYFPPNGLSWVLKPTTKGTENKPIPDFSVRSDPYTVGDIIVKVQGDDGRVIGRDRVQLVPRDNGYPSRGNFSGISITPAGMYILEVQSSIDASVSLVMEEPIEITQPPKRHSEINRVFQGFEDMMNFDI